MTRFWFNGDIHNSDTLIFMFLLQVSECRGVLQGYICLWRSHKSICFIWWKRKDAVTYSCLYVCNWSCIMQCKEKILRVNAKNVPLVHCGHLDLYLLFWNIYYTIIWTQSCLWQYEFVSFATCMVGVHGIGEALR